MLAGKQFVLDLYNCDYEILKEPTEIEAVIKKIMDERNLTLLSSFKQNYEEKHDFAIIIFFNYGHIIVHVFPDQGFVSVDVFSSLSELDLEKIAIRIKRELKTQKSKETYLRRGDFGSLNDMKPTIRKKTKAWRKVRNTSAKMFRLIINRKNK